VIVELMKNKFGNFVLEKALLSSDREESKMIMDAIHRNIQYVPSIGTINGNPWQKIIEK